MADFDYFRKPRGGYEPRTARAAMRCVEAGLLPMEAYVYRAASARAVTDEPFDLEELERVLSRDDLDLETNVALARVLEKLTRSDDTEVALFAAESLNQIESRYLARIETLKKDPQAGSFGDLARLYYEMAQLYQGAGAIRRFYLREAHAALKTLGRGSREDLELLVRVLIQLGLADQAAKALAPHLASRDPFFLVLEAEVQFSRRNYHRVFELAARLVQREESLTPAQRDLVTYWLDR